MTTTTVSKFIPEGYETIKDISILKDLLIYQDIGFGLGAAGVLINIPLLFIFFSSKRYLKKNKLLAYLAIGDTLNCLGVMFQGQQRGLWYRVAMEERIVPIQTYWSCAWIPMDILGLCGALFPAITTLSMGIERLLASNFPVIYRKQFADGGTKFLIFSLAYSFITLFTALTISFINRNVKVRYYCGRKVSFSKEFLTGVYVMNVVTYCLSLILTSICLYEIIKMLNKSKGTKENRDNLLRIKSLFVIAVISTITVSFPSFVSLASAFLGQLDAAISDPSDWMLVFKSSMNLFVYFFLNKEFRKRIVRIVTNQKELIEKTTIKISASRAKIIPSQT